MQNVLEDDQFDFATLNIPDPIPSDLTTKVKELVDDDTISTQNILDLHAAVTEREGDFAGILEQVVEIIEGQEHGDFVEIVRLYNENPLHLMFMGGDPDGIVLENSDDANIVLFGIENYAIDIQWIRETLGGEEEDTASLMDFDRIIGTHEDDPIDLSGDNYDPDE